MISLDQSDRKESTTLDFVRIVLRKWPLLLVGAAAGLALGFLASRWMHPKYQSSALIRIETDARRPTGSLGDMSDLFQSDTKAETEVELVQCNSVLGGVVNGLGLDNGWEPTGVLRRLRGKEGRLEIQSLRLPPVDPVSKKTWSIVAIDSTGFLLRDADGKPVLNGTVGTPAAAVHEGDSVGILIGSMRSEPGEIFKVYKIPQGAAIGAVRAKLVVLEKGRRTGLLQLTFKDQYPDRAMLVLNAIARKYIHQNVEARSAEARRTLDFLQSQLPMVKSRLDSLESILNAYRYKKGTVDISAEARVALDAQSKFHDQLLALEQQRQELLRLYNESHPSIRAIDAQKAEIQKVLATSNRQVKDLPLTQQELQKLSRDVEVNTSLYTSLLNNIQQLQVVQGGEVGNSRIVDEADTPAGKLGPKPILVILAGLLVGLLGAIGFTLVSHSFKDGVSDPAELERTGLPVLTQIPESSIENSFRKHKGRRPPLALSAPHDPSVELIRNLRVTLDLRWAGVKHRRLAVGGFVADVGKSFVAMNLAILYAQKGERVILVDSDLRKGRLQDFFGTPDAKGLSDILREGSSALAAVQTTNTPNLRFLSKGSTSPNPAELLGSSRLQDVLQELSQDADLVLIDTPPFLSVADSLPIMAQSTQNLLVLEPGAHRPDEINQALRILQNAHIENACFVLNKCDFALSGYRMYGAYSNQG